MISIRFGKIIETDTEPIVKLTGDNWKTRDSAKLVTVKRNQDIYANSVFADLKALSSRTKGSIFEKIVEETLISNGHTVEKPKSSEYDRIVNGKRAEIKGSFLWSGANSFKWQQIRPAQSYDYLILMAIHPEGIEFFGASKEASDAYVLQRDAKGNYIHAQHGGKTGSHPNTFEIWGKPNAYPDFFIPLDRFLLDLESGNKA